MRICIYGAGAVGGHLAAKLAAAGAEVSVVARGANLQAIRANGLRLLHGDEEIHARVAASDDPAALGAQDVVIVATKATGLAAFAQHAPRLCGRATPVVFAQNGIPWWYGMGLAPSRPRPPELPRLDPGGALRACLGVEQVFGAVVYSANDLEKPGVVRNFTPGNNMLVVGRADDAQPPFIHELRRGLEQAGLSSPPTADIRQPVWNKLVLNMGTSTVCLLTGTAVGTMRADPALAELAQRIGAEGRAIARAHGVEPDGAPPRPSGGHGAGAIRHKPSLVQDYEAGRPMELEGQFVAPLAFARAAGVAAPTFGALVPLALHLAAAKGLHKT